MRTHNLFNTRTHRLRILAALASLALALPVQASFHLMQIEQVIGGVNGDTTAQAVQLRMRSTGENFVTGCQLIAFDAAGNNPITLATFPSDGEQRGGRQSDSNCDGELRESRDFADRIRFYDDRNTCELSGCRPAGLSKPGFSKRRYSLVGELGRRELHWTKHRPDDQ